MILRSLEIAGFKSFGDRQTFHFKPGVTAVVGPNGSGKSNIADAIRWVLGEQKNRRLRIGKTEDIIFAGTEKKPRASQAEVKILFDNSTGKFPLDSAEVEISRNYLRSGEGGYRINGRRAKLSEIEQLLANVGFGKESYTVIGQGMIDQILISSGAERKLLFDEASGIRRYDLKRQIARKTLHSAQENLAKVDLLLKELAPTEAVLKRQSQIIHQKSQLEDDLQNKQNQYLHGEYTALQNELRVTTTELEANEKQLTKVTAELTNLQNSAKQQTQASSEFQKEAQKLKDKEQLRDQLNQELMQTQSLLASHEQSITGIAAEIQMQGLKQKEITKLQMELSKLQDKHDKHSRTSQILETKIADLNSNVKALTKTLDLTKTQLAKSQKKEFINHALSLVQLTRSKLRTAKTRVEVDEAMKKVARMLELALEDNSATLVLDVGKLQNQITKIMAAREEISESQTKEIIFMRSLELDIQIAENKLKPILQANSELAELKSKHTAEQATITNLKNQIRKLENEVAKIDKKILLIRDGLYKSNESNALLTATQTQQFSNVEKLAAERSRLEISIQQHQNQIRVIKQQIHAVEGLAKQWCGTSFQFQKNTAGSYPQLEEVHSLQAQLETIGEIDENTLVEATQTFERMEFLQSQQKDLTRAIADAQKLMQSLEATIKKRFNASFAKLNTAFEKYANQLFNGGSAQLVLTELGNEEEFGIEILVSPAAKRSKNINTLSGGEKALAAIALLAAILTTNPSPFIMLDEVDAALDDENSSRFITILQELAKKSQILVITHNYETMQAASELIGITTNQKGDSEVLQLQLQQASELANLS